MARHSGVTNDLYYLGRGTRVLGKSWFFNLASFAHCFMLAAHRRVEVYFAYEPANNWCYISTKSAQGDRAAPEATSGGGGGGGGNVAFELNSEGNMEIYWTRKMSDYHSILENWAGDSVRLEKQLRMRDRMLNLYTGAALDKIDDTGQEMPIRMSIKRLNIQYNGPQVLTTSSATLSSSGVNTSSAANFIDKIDGFGLMEREGFVEIAQLHKSTTNQVTDHESNTNTNNDDDPLHMVSTFGQCQSICAINLNCQSFSFCVKGAQVECLTSRLSFSSPRVAIKMINLPSNVQAKSPRSVYELELDGDSVPVKLQVRKHLNCAIHNKRFIKYFNSGIPMKVTSLLDKHILRAPGGLEQCARICYQQNVRAMQAHDKLLIGLNSTIAANLVRANDDGGGDNLLASHQSALESVLEARKSLLQDGCYEFKYLDSAQLQMLPEETLDKWNQLFKSVGQAANSYNHQPAAVQPSTATEIAGGYCALTSALNHLGPDGATKQPESFFFETLQDVVQYELNLVEMFEEEYGTNMLESKLTEDEQVAYSRIRQNQQQRQQEQLDSNSVELVRAILKRGDNFQMQIDGANKEFCARLCFKHTIGLWPACRSFDVIQEKSLGRSRLKCVFNTISKQQALASGRPDLIDSATSSSKLERWHYEPRVGDSGGLGSNLPYETELAYQAYELKQSIEGAYEDVGQFFLLTCLITGALASGLFAGITLGKQLERRRMRRHSQDSLAPAIDQAFQLNEIVQ